MKTRPSTEGGNTVLISLLGYVEMSLVQYKPMLKPTQQHACRHSSKDARKRTIVENIQVSVVPQAR